MALLACVKLAIFDFRKSTYCDLSDEWENAYFSNSSATGLTFCAEKLGPWIFCKDVIKTLMNCSRSFGEICSRKCCC